MKAGVYYGVEDFRVAEFPEPELKIGRAHV